MKHIFPFAVFLILAMPMGCKQGPPTEQTQVPAENNASAMADTSQQSTTSDTSKATPANTKLATGVGMKIPTKPLSEGATKPSLSHEIGTTTEQEIQDLRKKLHERNKHLSPSERLMNLQQIKTNSSTPTTNLKDLRDKTK